MQNEKDFPHHCKNYLYILDFEKFFRKIAYVTSVFENSDNKLRLYIINANKILLLVCLFD